MSENPKSNTSEASRIGLDEPSYKVGVADGRVQAIEESMDEIAMLIARAETMIAAFGAETDQIRRDNADHTVRALYLAFAAITGSENGSAAFQSLLAQSGARVSSGASTTH